tara:strand:- start:975 stop:1187 length:213 start_codon:yes stop_codon:yes gene_type:complete
MCGIGEVYKDYPYVYHQKFDEEDLSDIYKKAVCINKCPITNTSEIICVPTSHSPECPKKGTLYPSVRWFG